MKLKIDVDELKKMVLAGCSQEALDNVDLSEIIDCSNLFAGSKQLTSVPALNLPNCVDSSGMFYECSSLKTVGKLTLPNCKTADNLFWKCRSLTESSLYMPKTYNCSDLFASCCNLEAVDIHAPTCANFSGAFSGCCKLKKINMMNEVLQYVRTKYMLEDCYELLEVPFFESADYSDCLKLPTTHPEYFI